MEHLLQSENFSALCIVGNLNPRRANLRAQIQLLTWWLNRMSRVWGRCVGVRCERVCNYPYVWWCVDFTNVGSLSVWLHICLVTCLLSVCLSVWLSVSVFSSFLPSFLPFFFFSFFHSLKHLCVFCHQTFFSSTWLSFVFVRIGVE